MSPELIIKLPKHHKKTLIWLLLSLYVICLLIAHFCFEQSLYNIISDQVKAFSSSLLTLMAGIVALVSIIPSSNDGEIIEVPPKEITKEFDKMLSKARRWRYKGNFGRYLRGKVLPTLASKPDVHISACLIDPQNKDLCEKHAEYRGSINSIDKGRKYDSRIVALEVVTTIIIASWYESNNNMDIKIYLSGEFDPIRIDANDDAMMLTVEDRRSPALMITSRHFTADHFNLKMRTTRDQARLININGMRKGIPLSGIQDKDVRSVLSTANLSSILGFISTADIIESCNNSKNPYEN